MDADLAYDLLRIISMTAGMVTVGATIATWVKPLSLIRRLRFFILGAFTGLTGVTSFLRIGEEIFYPWHIIFDALLTVAAAIAVVGYYWEAPLEPSPTKVEVDEDGHTIIT